jgi:hypothetical protein
MKRAVRYYFNALPGNDRTLALRLPLRIDDLVNETVTVKESSRVRQGFLSLTINCLDIRIV